MRLRLYKLAFIASASLSLAFLGLWLYSLVSAVEIVHYSPRSSLSLASNDGRLSLRSDTVSVDAFTNLVGWSAGASWAVPMPLQTLGPGQRHDVRVLGFSYQARDEIVKGPNRWSGFWEIRVPHLAIVLIAGIGATWMWFKWRTAWHDQVDLSGRFTPVIHDTSAVSDTTSQDRALPSVLSAAA